MELHERADGPLFVLAPQGPLLTGGPAEEYEYRVQELLAEGKRQLVTDLAGVPYVDSAGVRAFVRGYTTAHRVGASFKLVAPGPKVRRVLELTRLDKVFEIHDSIDAAR